MLARLHLGRHRRDGAVLPALARRAAEGRRSRCWCWPSWPRRSTRSTTRRSPRISASGWKTGLRGTRAECRSPPTSSKATAARARSCAAIWRGAEHEGRALAAADGGLPADLRRAMARRSRARRISTRRCRWMPRMGGRADGDGLPAAAVAYGVAAVSHLVARALGGQGHVVRRADGAVLGAAAPSAR